MKPCFQTYNTLCTVVVNINMLESGLDWIVYCRKLTKAKHCFFFIIIYYLAAFVFLVHHDYGNNV